jgi:uncharacterized protein
MNQTTPSAPEGTAHARQNFSLNVIKGIALFGLLATSIWSFGGFTNNERTFFKTGTHGLNYYLLSVISSLLEGKMSSLLAIAYGAGILAFFKKKDHPVSFPATDTYIRSQFWLMLFGLLNAFLLLWPGDILFPFAVVGVLIFVFTRMNSRSLFIAAILCTLVYSGKLYWNYADDKKAYGKYLDVKKVEARFKQDSLARAKKDSLARPTDSLLLKDWMVKKKQDDSIAKKRDTLTKLQQSDKGAWEGLVKGLKFDSAATKAENKAMRTTYGKVWGHVKGRAQQNESIQLYKTGIWEIGSMMFLGMALLGIGFFSSRFSSSRYFILGAVCLLAGAGLSWFRIHFEVIRLTDYLSYIKGRSLPFNFFLPIERGLLALGYASLLIWLIRMNVLSFIWKGFAKAGKMALTNYLLQSLFCTFFFYGYGFSYFGRLSQWELYFVVAEIMLVQVVFSVFWLRAYEMGPVEWLWRCLVYRKWLPNRKPITDPS